MMDHVLCIVDIINGGTNLSHTNIGIFSISDHLYSNNKTYYI